MPTAATERFLTIDDLTHLPKPTWQVEGVFECGALVMLAGPPGSYKSFMALDWILSMAAEREWNGRHVTPAKVLYVLGEGKSSLLKRILAWKIHHRLDAKEEQRLSDNFRVTFDVPQMTMKSSVDNLLAGLADIDYSPQVVVIDTFARSLVGMDENSQKDAGLWIDQAERLRGMGWTVIFLHHTARNTEFGHRYRGSSALNGAVDTGIVMFEEKRYHIKFKIDKQKDHDSGPPLSFRPQSVGGDLDSCVLVPMIEIDERLTEEGQKMEKRIDQLICNEDFPSDRERARVLAVEMGMSESAAQSRISRRHRELGTELTKDVVDG